MPKFKNRALLAGLMLCAAGVVNAQTSNSIVTFSVDMATNILDGTFVPGTDAVNVRGTYNGWDPGQTLLVRVGSTTVYTNTVNDTNDANGASMNYVFNINGSTYESLPTSINGANNRTALLPSTSGASLVLPTAFFSDKVAIVTNDVRFQVDVAQQIALGTFNPATSVVTVRGTLFGNFGDPTSLSPLNTLTNDPTILRTNLNGLVTSNVYVGTWPVTNSPGAFMEVKFVYTTGASTFWDGPQPPNTDGGGNRYFANVAQTLPVVDFSDQPFAPISQVTFNVDMSIQVLAGTYSNYPAFLAGSLNGWSTSATPLTNNPAAVNTNIYSAQVAVGQGSIVSYKFTYQNNGTVWENPATTGGNNRTYAVPSVTSTDLPPVYFNDLLPDDVFLVSTPVTFAVNMSNAVGTDAHAFNPGSDSVYINGQFANNGNWYAWAGGINPASAPPGYQMVEQGLTTIYTNTIIVPPGTPVGFAYKYGMDAGSLNGGPSDDEAGFGQNHFRVVRETANLPYAMPGDTFGNQYGEPFFTYGSTGGGNLIIGPASGGIVPVSWLGRPGAHLQTKTSLASGVWQDLWVTDGTNWTSGHGSANGFVSVTNWPAGGNTFFRLVKP